MTDTPPHMPLPSAAILRAPSGGHDTIAGTRFEMVETGLAAATGGAYTARVFRTTSGGSVSPTMHWHDSDFQYVHVLRGEIDFQLGDQEITTLRSGDAIYLPKGCRHCVTRVSADLEFLEIFSPATVATILASDGAGSP